MLNRELSASFYRYSLDKSSRKFICPQCGKKTLVRYVDNTSGAYLDNEKVGKCDRSVKCNYHLPPRMAGYTTSTTPPNTSESKPLQALQSIPPTVSTPEVHTLPIDPSPFYRHREQSALFAFLLGIFKNRDTAERACFLYRVGASRTGGTVFWQIDLKNQVRTGKVLYYNPLDGKRIHALPPQWVHKLIPTPAGFALSQCPFGLHRLIEDTKTPVAIVESEKTAVILSMLDTSRVWIAVGGKNNLSARMLSQIPRQELELYPDKDAFREWQSLKAKLENETSKRLTVIDWFSSNQTLAPTADPADLAVERLRFLHSHFGVLR